MRDLENTVLNGVSPAASPEGSGAVRRTLKGILASLTTNVLALGQGYVPADDALTEEHVNGALRTIWEVSGNKPDLMVVGGAQKRRINSFIQASQRYATADERMKNLVSVYESDYGVCRVLLSRYMPADAVLFLDSTKVAVVPLVGRSFQYKPLAVTGDYVSGEVLGEYTVEVRCEKGHGVVRGLGS